LLQTDEIAQNNALIRFYMKADPGRMTDSEWSRAVAEIEFCLGLENEN